MLSVFVKQIKGILVKSYPIIEVTYYMYNIEKYSPKET